MEMLNRVTQGEANIVELPRKNKKKIKIAHHEHL